MGQIKPGRYERNGVAFDVRERGEFTLIEVTGEEWTFNANGFHVTDLNPDDDLYIGTEDAQDAVEPVEDVLHTKKNSESSNTENMEE